MDDSYMKGQTDAAEALSILVVEDDTDSREMLCELLSLLGHKVHSAARAEEADAKLEECRVKVLLTDISLPGMSGVELARKALQRDPELSVIFASGYGGAPDADFPYRSLLKPYDLMQLQSVLAEAAGKVRTS